MSEGAALLGIGASIFVGAASPGPSFIVAARLSIAKSRLHGLCGAVGMGLGGLVFAAASLLGLSGFLLAVPSAYWLLKIVGGVYLLYLGVCIWKGAKEPLGPIDEKLSDGGRSFLSSICVGLCTHLSNPKAAIVYTGVFAAFLPESPTLTLDMLILVTVFCVELFWYAFVALMLSSARPRALYVKAKSSVDRMAGGLLGVLGAKLVSTAGH